MAVNMILLPSIFSFFFFLFFFFFFLSLTSQDEQSNNHNLLILELATPSSRSLVWNLFLKKEFKTLMLKPFLLRNTGNPSRTWQTRALICSLLYLILRIIRFLLMKKA